MDPVTGMLLMQGIGAGLGLLGGDDEGQELQSFEGTEVDPKKMLAGAGGGISEMGRALVNKANKPVQLRGVTAQTPAGLSGGPLPFDMGFSAEDPAISDPSMLSLEGLGLDPNKAFSFGTKAAPSSSANKAVVRSPTKQETKLEREALNASGFNEPYHLGRTTFRNPKRPDMSDPEAIQRAFDEINKVYGR